MAQSKINKLNVEKYYFNFNLLHTFELFKRKAKWKYFLAVSYLLKGVGQISMYVYCIPVLLLQTQVGVFFCSIPILLQDDIFTDFEYTTNLKFSFLFFTRKFWLLIGKQTSL